MLELAGGAPGNAAGDVRGAGKLLLDAARPRHPRASSPCPTRTRSRGRCRSGAHGAAGRTSRIRARALATRAGSASTTSSKPSPRIGHTAPRQSSPHTSSTSPPRFSSPCERGSVVAIQSDARRPDALPDRRRRRDPAGSRTVTTAKDAAARRGGCWRSTDDGFAYRDLNDNGVLDPYEDPRLPIEERVDDLLARMTLEEKAALLFHQGLVVPDDGAVGDEPDAISPGRDAEPRPRARSDALQHLLGAGPAGARRVAQPDARGGGEHAARDPGHDLVGSAARLRRQPGHEHDRRRVLAVARADRAGCDARRGPRARVRRHRAPRVPRRRASASRCIRWPISPPSRAGAAQPGRSARTPSSRRGW